MSSYTKDKPKSSCDRFYRSTNSSSSEKQVKSAKKVTPKKTAKKNSKDGKSSSAGALSSYLKGTAAKPKKTTKSDLCFTHSNVTRRTVIDYCKRCGDQKDSSVKLKEKVRKHPKDKEIVQVLSNTSSKSSVTTVKSLHTTPSKSVERVVVTKKSIESIPSTSKIKAKNNKTGACSETQQSPNTDSSRNILINGVPVKQYYKNENFRRASKSTQEMNKFLKKMSLLDTINEQPEKNFEGNNDSDSNSIFEIYTGSEDSYCDDDVGIDADEYDSLKKLRDFRDDNYFECHSSESRLKSKGSVTNLVDHKCVYRFYLNERLFPVPLNSDHQKTVRCTECNLPFDKNRCNSKNINGTIQAKVKIGSGDEAQDMVLMLPVQEPLIINQKKRDQKEEDELVYFGVIKLDSNGNSMFSQTLPTDSLALKYQKGYQEFGKPPDGYEYKKSEDCEVIVI